MGIPSKSEQCVQTGRRGFLRQTAGVLAAACWGQKLAYSRPEKPLGGMQSRIGKTRLELDRPRGAIYIPARPYNAYQVWRDYNPEVTRRDTKYAKSLGLNAFRLWLSYEFWLQDRKALQQGFADFLQTCSMRGIKVMPVLFEGDGVEPTRRNLVNADPFTASDVLSPASEIVRDQTKWGGPRNYVDWFMQHFGNDRRLLAIEVHNEPHPFMREIFARAMIEQAARQKGSVPLTVGGMNLRQSLLFLDAGIDILETHKNFPPSAKFAREFILQEIINPQKLLKKPVWLTEWQRIRHGSSGWGSERLAGKEWEPNYASMAPIVRSFPIGNFFWSLMLKPAWLLPQRKKGTLNGVFHEDGAVWSLADAKAISGNSRFEAAVRRQWPEWAKSIPSSLGLS